MSRLGRQSDMERRAGTARAISADAKAIELRQAQVLLASGFMLATLLALLLINP